MKHLFLKYKMIVPLLLLLMLMGCGKVPTNSNDSSDETGPGSSAEFPWQEENSQQEDVPRHEDGRALVTLSAFFLTDDMQNAVAAFNKTNTEYYVEIQTAEDGTTASEYWDREMIELMAGRGADLFTKNAQFIFTTFIEKGIIEDLTPYIERDIPTEDYLENSLYAYAYDGKVYAIEPSFSISFLAGSRELFGDASGWNLEDASRLMKDHPELLAFESYSSPGSFLKDYLAFGNVDYTDYENLRACIEFDKAYSKTLPSDTPAIPGQSVLVTSEDLHNVLGWADCEALYGQELTPIGYVNEQEEGILHSSIAWSINSASKQKEGAWAFLRFLLSEEYQREFRHDYTFSPLKAILEEQLEQYSKPMTNTFYVEELGQEVTITQGYTLSRASGANFPNSVEIECMTPEQLQTVENLIARSKVNCFSWDQTAQQIIMEEAEAYFNDRSTLDEVMKNIQNRIDLYVSEKQ